jgi:hypothetical protein
MTAFLPARLKHALLAPVAALIVLAFALFIDLSATAEDGAAAQSNDKPDALLATLRRQRVEATRRDLQPLFDELRNE